MCFNYAHVIAIKMGVSSIDAYSLFVWDNRDIRGLYFSNFYLEKYILVKMQIQHSFGERLGS